MYQETLNRALIAKLDYLCFGSIIPRVIHSQDLSKYRKPIQEIQIHIEETPDGKGLSFKATEK